MCPNQICSALLVAAPRFSAVHSSQMSEGKGCTYSYGPKKRSPLKWMMCEGASAIQTSVSHAISQRYLDMARRVRKARACASVSHRRGPPVPHDPALPGWERTFRSGAQVR